MPICNEEDVIFQRFILARQAHKVKIVMLMPKVWHFLFIALFFFILQGASANLGIANPSTTFEINESDNQYKILTNLSDNNISENNLTYPDENDSELAPPLGETAPASLDVTLTASKFTVCPGGEFTYTIQICNFGSLAVTDIAIKDIINQSLEIISASPEPEDDGLWHISSLEPGECFTITLVVSVPNYDAKFNENSGVSGHGYVSIHNDYSTTPQSEDMYNLRNCVYVAAKGISYKSACLDVTVANNAGTTLKEREYGSGSYDRDNIIGITRLESGSIQYNSSLDAVYHPISTPLPHNRALSYNSRWGEDLKTNIQFTGGSITESYRHTNRIKKNSSAQLSWNASALKTDSEFDGQGNLRYIHQLSPYELDPAMRIDFERVKPSFEGEENYLGSFKINATIDTIDFDASSKRSASGIGIVSNDKRIGGTGQRTYEYGTGSYQSEESVQTLENYITKEIQAKYMPVSYSLRQGKAMNISTKWGEGSWSQTKGVSFMGEGVSNADYFKKNSTARWKSDLESEGNYSGKGWLKAFLKDENQSDMVRLEEEYIGNYSVERRMHLQEISWADMAHLYVMNEGRLVKEVTKNITAAKYSITIINDGYTDLGPIYVRDAFPNGTQFISSSVTPSKIGSGYANWTFDSLLMGQSLKIDLNLKPMKGANDLVNCVSVSGQYDHRLVVAGNFSTIERGSLNRNNLNIKAYKNARINPADTSIIVYRIAVENQDNRSIVARITDILPDGLMFLNSSIEPQNITNDLSWVIMDIAPGETKYVDYSAQALWTTQLVNRAHIDAHAIDGSGRTALDVNAETNLIQAALGNYSRHGYPSEWKPPEWGLNYSEDIFNASSIQSGCTNGACPLNAYEEDEGFKNIYGVDTFSGDIYGEYNGSEDIYGEDYIYGLDPVDDYESTIGSEEIYLEESNSTSSENITDQEASGNLSTAKFNYTNISINNETAMKWADSLL
jgi:large repetitive protein